MSEWYEHVDQRGSDECWPWLRSVDSRGYPQVNVRGKVLRVHRLVVEARENQIVHHVCRNRACLNPAHLLIVETTHEHFQHHLNETCSEGHLMDYISPSGQRQCRSCKARRQREYRRRHAVLT